MAKKERRKFIYCEPCGFKRIYDGEESIKDLRETKRSPISRGTPTYDKVNKKTITPKAISQNRLFQCPKCGKGIVVKGLPEAFKKTLAEVDKIERERMEEQNKRDRLLDGMPHKMPLNYDEEFRREFIQRFGEDPLKEKDGSKEKKD